MLPEVLDLIGLERFLEFESPDEEVSGVSLYRVARCDEEEKGDARGCWTAQAFWIDAESVNVPSSTTGAIWRVLSGERFLLIPRELAFSRSY